MSDDPDYNPLGFPGAGGFPDQIQQAEASAPDAVSPAGARSVMQVMPQTAMDPGYGVRPGNDLVRVGRDYATAMLAHYGNPVLAAAAYNAGPGQVDKWLGDYGDPRTGAISPEAWVAKLPFQETRQYATRFLGGLGQTSQASQAQVPGASTSNDLATSPPAPGAPSPGVALRLLQLALPNHKLEPVDYDPWAVAAIARGGSSGGQSAGA